MSARGAVDYWCNAFTPDRLPLWEASLAAQGVPMKLRKGEDDGFAAADVMAARMDAAGVETLLIPTCDLVADGERDFEPFAARPEEIEAWSAAHPGRFRGLWSFDPRNGMNGVDRAADMLARPWAVGLHYHTHSFDCAFDQAAMYPYYTLASQTDVPVVMQAGTSGGLMPSECGRPIGIDRPALYFPEVRFVLSHTGWPWVEEAIAMALKFPNVFLGSATQPPRRWSDTLVHFASGVGRDKFLLGTGFPTTGQQQVIEQLEAAIADPGARAAIQGDTARRVFSRL